MRRTALSPFTLQAIAILHFLLGFTVLVLGAALVMHLGAGIANAATPSSGTLSETSTEVTWSGGQGLPTASATCSGPDSDSCDNFRLHLVPPSFASKVEISIDAFPTDDYDLEVYGPSGQLVGSSANSPGQIERVALIEPSAGTYTVSVSNFAAVLAFEGRATLAPISGGSSNPNGTHSFAIHAAPDGLGLNSGEPSVGINAASGRAMYIAGLETLRVEFDDCGSPAPSTWTEVSFPLTSTISLDPILFTDSATGRTFASQLSAKCSSMAFTDNDGLSWTPSQGCGINAGVDHQSVGGGPFAAPLERDPGGALYPHAVYYCSQDVAIAQCARSDTGGLTFNEAVPIYNILECGGLHGHVKVAPNDGTVYVPNKGCNGEQAVAVSEQNGLLATWEVRRVPGTVTGEWDPSVGIGSGGAIYLGMTNGGRPMVAVSLDKGLSWSDPVDVGVGAGPNGNDILNTAFPVVAVGDDDRAAFGFLGAEQGGDGGGEDPNSGHVWHPYVAMTTDGGASWSTVNITPGDPVQRGTICSGGTVCGSTRNLLDFNDMTVDPEGRVLFAFADGCLSDCAKGGPNTGSELATLARQVNGPRLFAAHDALDVPEETRTAAEFVDGDPSRVLVSWTAPDDRGEPITAYRIYRRFEGDRKAKLRKVVSADTRSYVDKVNRTDAPVFYRVTAVNGFGEGGSCEWNAPELPEDPDPCAEPGLRALSDPPGDDLAGQPSHDVRSLDVAQVGDLVVFTLKTAGLDNPTPDTTWPVVFEGPGGFAYFVKMETDVLGTVRFASGQGTDPTQAGLDADPSSGFDADGTIRIAVSRDALGRPAVGEELSNFLVRVRVESPDGSALTPDNMPDDVTPAGQHTVAFCASSP